MLDTKTRLLEAQYALHSLELEIEQYRIHIGELSAHADEAERARAALDKLIGGLAGQRRYCNLLAKAEQADDRAAKNGSRAA